MADVAGRAGAWLVCGPGCTRCCHTLFPITPLDARRLQRGLAETRRDDPHRARGIEARARDAAKTLTDGLPVGSDGRRLVQDEARLDAFFQRHDGLACPVLNPATGRCDLYAWRPIACRTYGPPLRFADERTEACDLCFDGAPPEAVEGCRIDPDPDGLEQALLLRMGIEEDATWDTLIALALIADPASDGR
ncbi:MAG: YkgJ family cysteine cluster protein [Actinobacteria bacterium]|nr:YkgJ family cysteine cluster protein [Actinomycetota bacterium]